MPEAGRAGTPGRERRPSTGAHPLEWLCELVGTALVLLVGVSAVTVDFGSGAPLAAVPMSPRLLLTGLVFAATGSLFSLTPLGRLSGAHLNPVVTIAFWTQRKVHWHDLVGYVVAQFAGALGGTALAALLWGSRAASVHLGATAPGRGIGDAGAVLLEALMTAAVLLTIFLMTSFSRTTRFTPLVLWVEIAVLVWQLAPFTGTSLNPARSFGPALLAPLLGPYWVYVAGPLLGALAATGVFALLPETRVLTTKLFHDPRYRSVLGTSLPAATVR